MATDTDTVLTDTVLTDTVLTPAGVAPRLLLVDISGFIFRAYHALPPFTSPSGIPTGAVYGFCTMLEKLLGEQRPEYMAAVFDTGKPTFRHELYPAYKANRPPAPEDLVVQFPLVERAVECYRVAGLRLDGVEADDLIATYTRLGRAAGMVVTVVSSDKDLMQLVGDGVTLLDTMKNRTIGPAEVQAKYGVLPEQLGDLLALVGDTSDNVPGIPGVGPKTAAKLLGELGSLQGVLASAEQVSGKKLKENLVQYADQARLSRRLVQLKEDCAPPLPLSALRLREPDGAALELLFGELGFSTLAGRRQHASTVDRSAYRTVLSVEELDACLDEVRRAGSCAVDVETTGLDPMRALLVGVSLAWAPGEACYIPLHHDYLGRPDQLPWELVRQRLEPLLGDERFPKVGQNAKYDWLVLGRAGLEVRGLTFDSMLASYVLDPSRNSHGLDSLARDHLGHTMLGFKEVTGKDRAFSMVELGLATEYAAEDADVTLRLARHLGPLLEREPALQRLLQELELPLWPVLGEMERRGVVLQAGRLHAMSGEVQRQLETIEADIQRQAGWEVNVNSPKQLQKLLFEDLQLTTGRKTKTGYSTDSDVLMDLALEHPVAAQIDEYRTLAKLKNTYIDTLPALVNRETGRVHTSYNQAVAATGRLSSSDPNLQNIPIRTELGREIRAAFVAPPGRVLLSADYSQVELRVLAHLSGDPLLVSSFREGQDVHRRTAAEVFGVPPGEVTAEQRRVAKAVNFGVIYGQTDWGLSRQLRIPQHTARQYIESYFLRHAGVKEFMDRAIEQAREERLVRTLLGRVRPVPDIASSRRNVRMYAERVVRNTPIQGTAADLMKMAMIRIARRLAAERLDAPMILTVHDELVFEVRPADVEVLSSLVRGEMSGVLALDVPLQVDIGTGETWAEAHG